MVCIVTIPDLATQMNFTSSFVSSCLSAVIIPFPALRASRHSGKGLWRETKHYGGHIWEKFSNAATLCFIAKLLRHTQASISVATHTTLKITVVLIVICALLRHFFLVES